MGDDDLLFCPVSGCASIPNGEATEAKQWVNAASFEMKIVPDAGHDLNLQRNAHVFFALAQRWIDQNFGGTTAGR